MVISSYHDKRTTLLRSQIIDICKKNKGPLTVPEIQKALFVIKVLPHKTSLYRNIELLCAQNLLEEVILDANVKHYEISSAHHHHMVCTECSGIKCIASLSMEKSVRKMEKEITETMRFHIQDHQFSFFGVCDSCFCKL